MCLQVQVPEWTPGRTRLQRRFQVRLYIDLFYLERKAGGGGGRLTALTLCMPNVFTINYSKQMYLIVAKRLKRSTDVTCGNRIYVIVVMPRAGKGQEQRAT